MQPLNFGQDKYFQAVSQCTNNIINLESQSPVEPIISNFSSPTISSFTTPISPSTSANNNLTPENPVNAVSISPALPSNSAHNSLFKKLKPKEVVHKILNCKKFHDIDEMLSTDISNKYFILENNFDHKHIVCVWKSGNRIIHKFKFSCDTDTNICSLFNIKKDNSNLIPVIPDNKTIQFFYKSYKAACGNNFQMHIFHTTALKIVQFIGEKPNCTYCNLYDQKFFFLKLKV